MAFVIYLVAAIQISAIQASPTFASPIHLLLTSTLRMAALPRTAAGGATHMGYLRTLLQRLPHTWVAANLGMAGISVLAMPLVTMSIRTCSALPLPPWTAVGWWAFAVVGALAAMILLLIYERWAVRRGFRAWSVLAWGDGEVATPSWRRLWWWILLSYLVLFAGIAAGRVIQQVLLR